MQLARNLWKQSWESGTTRWSIDEVRQPSYTPAMTNNQLLIANPELKWETTITRNLGFDFALFNSKLSGSLELYKNTVKDLAFGYTSF